MAFFNKKTSTVGKHFILDESEKKKMATSINKLIGQLERIKQDVLNDDACDESLTQILAVKGGVQRVGLDLLGKGVLDCLQNYSKDELDLIIKNLFKLT